MTDAYRVAAKASKDRSTPGIECVSCGTVNRPTRSRCDCGFELRPTDDQIRRTLATRSDKRIMQIVIGAAAIAAGVGFSYMTHAGAVKSGGSGYVIFTGVIIYGSARVIWGYRGLREVRAWQRRTTIKPVKREPARRRSADTPRPR